MKHRQEIPGGVTIPLMTKMSAKFDIRCLFAATARVVLDNEADFIAFVQSRHA